MAVLFLHEYLGERWRKMANLLGVRNDVQIRDRFKNVLEPGLARTLAEVSLPQVVQLAVQSQFRWSEVARLATRQARVKVTDSQVLKLFMRELRKMDGH